MINSIVLSSDAEKIYLIDNGRAIEFNLNEQGVVIGLLDDQLSVASTMRIPGPAIESGQTRTRSTGAPVKTIAGETGSAEEKANLPIPPLFPTSVDLPLQNSQWTLSFRPQEGVLFAIGATDIDFDRSIVKPRIHIFPLNKGVVRMTKEKDALRVAFLSKV